MSEKLNIKMPIIVEGRYDKARISEIINGTIITTDGFGIFNNTERLALIKKLSVNGVIILTDSDGAGRVIRSHIASAVPADKVYNLYTPEVFGKERRKKTASKEGKLGVEGISEEILRKLLLPFAGDAEVVRGDIVKADFYEDGLTGGENSVALRDAFAREAELPHGMTANALLSAVNILFTKDEYKELCKKCKK